MLQLSRLPLNLSIIGFMYTYTRLHIFLPDNIHSAWSAPVSYLFPVGVNFLLPVFRHIGSINEIIPDVPEFLFSVHLLYTYVIYMMVCQ